MRKLSNKSSKVNPNLNMNIVLPFLSNATGERREESDISSDDGLCEAKPQLIVTQPIGIHQEPMPYPNQFAPGINFPYGAHPSMQYLPPEMIHMTNYHNL